jgi:hypothetical protein
MGAACLRRELETEARATISFETPPGYSRRSMFGRFAMSARRAGLPVSRARSAISAGSPKRCCSTMIAGWWRVTTGCLAKVTHLPLDRPRAQPDPLLPLELLPNHIGVAGMAAEPLRHPLLEPGQRPRPTPTAIRHPAAICQIPANRSYDCTPAHPGSAGHPTPTPSAAASPGPPPPSALPLSAVTPPEASFICRLTSLLVLRAKANTSRGRDRVKGSPNAIATTAQYLKITASIPYIYSRVSTSGRLHLRRRELGVAWGSGAERSVFPSCARV